MFSTMLETKKHVLELLRQEFTITNYYRKFFRNEGVFNSFVSLTSNQYYIELLTQASLFVDGSNRADFYLCYSPKDKDFRDINKLIAEFLDDKEFQNLEEMIEILEVVRDSAVEMLELFLSNQELFEKGWKQL